MRNKLNLPVQIAIKVSNIFNVGFVGRLEEEKGYGRFIEIAKKKKFI